MFFSSMQSRSALKVWGSGVGLVGDEETNNYYHSVELRVDQLNWRLYIHG